jgi:signal transduction histidine kinase
MIDEIEPAEKTLETATANQANLAPVMTPVFDEGHDLDLLVKSRHLVYFRLAFALISLIVGAAVSSISRSDSQPWAVFFIAGCAVAYTSIALLVTKKLNPLDHRHLQILNGTLVALDIVALSALVHFTHGIESDLYFLYLLPIVLASHTFGRRGIFITALAASIAYMGLLLFEFYQSVPTEFIGPQHGLAADYVRRLWARILARSAMLAGVSFIWALFCEHMSQVAQQGAMRLRSQLDANNRLMSETRAQAAREQLINAISSAIRSTLDIDQILSTTVNQLSSALGVSRCAIITPADHINDAPDIWEAENFTHNHRHEIAFGRAFCEFVLDNLAHYIELAEGEFKKTFVYEDPLSETSFALIRPEMERLQFRSLIAQPIMYGTDSKGVILIGECEKSRDWTYSEIELIKAVAGQVAIAIEHARLVDQLSRKNRDLLQKNLHLDAKNLELRTIQSQLIHQEKMASLGRMVAGIAHELNNPVNFVHGNLPYLREYFEDLKRIAASLDNVPVEQRQAVDDLKKQLKYDFLVADLDNIIADLAEGAERIRQIIKNLRSFSRLDEAELKEASIQEGIESTIKILNQYYGRDKIRPETNFAEIPSVVCYPGKLNQVWMNLLSNAAQAVAEQDEPRVQITTELDGNWVIVSISDNGTGIKPQDQSKIFEPFYTTKPVGQGTGLGLSICHSIIERHGGSIWFETAQGQGTKFNVKIPLRAEPERPDESRQQMVVTE